MTLLTAHKILIASAIALFVFFAVHRFIAFLGDGDATALFAALASAGATLGLAAYYRSIQGKRRAP